MIAHDQYSPSIFYSSIRPLFSSRTSPILLFPLSFYWCFYLIFLPFIYYTLFLPIHAIFTLFPFLFHSSCSTPLLHFFTFQPLYKTSLFYGPINFYTSPLVLLIFFRFFLAHLHLQFCFFTSFYQLSHFDVFSPICVPFQWFFSHFSPISALFFPLIFPHISLLGFELCTPVL